MKHKFIKSISRLASKRYQDLYISNANHQAYIVPEFLLDEAIYLCDIAINRKIFDANQTIEINKLRIFLSKIDNDFLNKYSHENIKKMIDNDTLWLELRSKSKELLTFLNIDADTFLHNEINQNEN